MKIAFFSGAQLNRIEQKLDLLLKWNASERFDLARIERKEGTMSAQLDRLTADVAANKTVEESAVTLIAGLAQQIRDLANDPAALAALADSLEAQTSSLSAAVTANTPAA